MPDKKDLEEGFILSIDFEKRGGLIPVAVQDNHTLEILMLGYANEEAVQLSIKKRMATFWSTSREELWTKGETSGDFLAIVDILIDCDQDSLIYKVTPQGSGACHTKDKNGLTRKSCFYRSIDLKNGNLR